MANWNDPQPRSGFGASPSLGGRTGARTGYDAGLRRHMLSIYNYMASGVLLSGVIALLVSRSPAMQQVLFGPGPLKWLVMLAPLGFVFAISFGVNRMKTSTLQILFWSFCGVMGLSLASIFMVYTGASVAKAFFSAAAAFTGLSLIGYTTKKDLTGMGSFLIMGVWGILAAMIINMIWPSQALGLAISILGVLIFAGLTAYDTQRLKNTYAQIAGTEFVGKMVVMGALTLYLDFINMFTFLLQLMGDRR